ncbi:MAG TPA: LuxR C-terminal-related transcriptional regulator [Trueperaceae bacterium]|nr:LuxR C-terminal-related transcriptional regulator [Trueperaceae bacterium]
MTTGIRTTKLYVPKPPTASVTRLRLTTLFDQGLTGRLTLVSAPAGFGKTTAVTEWIGHLRRISGPAVAWLSLDESDADPSRFLGYLIAALQTAIPDVGAEALSLLGSSPSPASEPVLTLLLNELAGASHDVVVVLDDYHVVDSDKVDAIMTLLLEQTPPRLHLVVTTREDPAFPLPRLRARGHLVEVRAADLRFTTEEAAEFLTVGMGLAISVADVARLEERTEGWIAGLQLAALSLRGRDDVGAFIDSFAGSHRFVLDYLFDEVLRLQPDEVRGFLLRTSILERLSGPLCDALTGGKNSHDTLIALERANLFVVPLDDDRRWYRYHHLFADVLRVYAASELLEELPDLHLRASAWLEEHGSVADAVRHALARPDVGHAADLIEANAQAMRRTRQGPALLRWIEALPAEVVRSRPLLGVALAATLLDSGRLESVEQHLRAAEQWLETRGGSSGGAAIGGAGDPVAAQLPGLIAMHRAGLAMLSGDAAGATLHARRALEVAPADDLAARGGAMGLVGLALWSGGELEAAHQSFAEGMVLLRMGGFVADSIGGVASLADIRAAQGRLHDALEELTDALTQSAGLGDADPRGALALHVSMSELLIERNDLDGTEHHLQLAQRLGERTGWAHSRSRWCVASALLKLARGEVDVADLVDQADRLFTHDFFPNLRPVRALRARTDLARGRLGEARVWLDGTEISDGLAALRLSYLREYEHVTAARVLLAEFRRDREESTLVIARELLDRLLGAAEEGGRGRSVLEILVVQAMVEKAAGDLPRALTALERALALAEPQGHVRVFLDEGSAMEELVRRVEGQLGSRTARRFSQVLLEGFKEARGTQAEAGGSERVASSLRRAEAEWVDPLTERELEVLLLIAEGLSNRAIAQRLFRAESTIKGLNRVLFEKLQVESRTEAVARARELGLL